MIVKRKEEKFTPVTMEIRVETRAEYRMFFELYNCESEIREIILKDRGSDGIKNEDMAKALSDFVNDFEGKINYL